MLGAHRLISIYTKHRTSFSRQICSLDKPSAVDHKAVTKALGPEFARCDLLRTPCYPRDPHNRANAWFFRGCYPGGQHRLKSRKCICTSMLKKFKLVLTDLISYPFVVWSGSFQIPCYRVIVVWGFNLGLVGIPSSTPGQTTAPVCKQL